MQIINLRNNFYLLPIINKFIQSTMKKLYPMMLAGIITLGIAAGVTLATASTTATATQSMSRAAESEGIISIDVSDGTYEGGLRLENNTPPNVGYAKNGGKATYSFNCSQAGVYQANINFNWFQNAGDFIFTVTDKATGDVEVRTVYHVSAKHEAQITLPGLIRQGEKSLTMEISSSSTGYIANWISFTLNRVGDSFAQISDITAVGIDSTPYDGYDYSFNLPVDFSAQSVTLNVKHTGATVKATGEGCTVTTKSDGVYEVTSPAPNSEAIVTFTLTPDDGAFSEQLVYKVRIFHIGDVRLSGITVDDVEVTAEIIENLNNDASATLAGNIYTAIPVVKATFVDGSSADGILTLDGTTASAKFSGKAGDKTKDFTLSIEGIHLYTPTEADKRQDLRYDSSNKQDNNTWSNGLFTIDPCGDGWGGTQFKFKGDKITLSIPSDMLVKQLILGGLADNYAPGRITSVTTNEGSSVYLPTSSSFNNPASTAYNLVINIDGHKAGSPFEINIEGGSQPVMWFEFVYEEFALNTPVELAEKSCTDLTGKNHTVLTFSFDRAVGDAEVTFNGSTIKAEGGSSSLQFALWDMEYDKEYTFTIPAGTLHDSYGNTNADAISYTFTTGKENAPVEAITAERFIEVSDVDGLRNAVASLSQTNSNAESPLTVIYIHDGDYDLGHDTGATDACLGINKVYNVSLIGESQEGVLLHGTRTGISYPVLSTRYSTNIYMENLTVRNDLDFGKSDRVGVGVAHYGGNLDIMKNVTLQSVQDTQVTGERGYYLNCTIHGSVDYICGGGDHFYDHCTFVNTHEGGYITAPSTSASTKYGYVMSDCIVKGAGKYSLGRPWQNEPRNYFINTTMEALPNDGGWGQMSNLPTHFYEYGSKDADGNLLDLSKRTNSPTSTNTYTPVLTVEEAAVFTLKNVLGYKDSWLATELTDALDAPAIAIEDGVITWSPVNRAAGYIVYADGKLIAYTTDTRHTVADRTRAVDGTYTVCAVNANGARGIMSEGADFTSGIADIEVSADENTPEYYNLQGIRVQNPSNGIYIRRQGDKIEKVIL